MDYSTDHYPGRNTESGVNNFGMTEVCVHWGLECLIVTQRARLFTHTLGEFDHETLSVAIKWRVLPSDNISVKSLVRNGIAASDDGRTGVGSDCREVTGQVPASP
jgi:hypothetical protein